MKAKEYKQSLCWFCGNFCGGCSWSAEFKPVPGWKAEHKPVKVSDKYTDSYFVSECPQYVADRKGRSLW